MEISRRKLGLRRGLRETGPRITVLKVTVSALE